MCNGSSPLFPSTPASTRDQKFSDHERILILQLFKFFDLLSQKQYPVGETDTTAALSVCTWIEVFFECWDWTKYCSHLCSRNVACISQTLTKDRRFLSSVQFSDIQMLPMVWASSRSLDALITWHTDFILMAVAMNCILYHNQEKLWSNVTVQTCFSACSAGQPCTCLIRFSLKWAARVGVKVQEGRVAEAVGGAEAELGALLPLEVTWLGPGEGLLWLLQWTHGEEACKHRDKLFMKTLLTCHKADQSSSSKVRTANSFFPTQWSLEFNYSWCRMQVSVISLELFWCNSAQLLVFMFLSITWQLYSALILFSMLFDSAGYLFTCPGASRIVCESQQPLDTYIYIYR